MKNGVFLAVVIIIAGASAGLLALGNSSGSEKGSLPPSLDRYYKSVPPEYLIKMFELGESFVGISAKVLQGDMANAKKSFSAFSQNYKNSAGMVPEWKRYYNMDAVEKIGSSLDAGNIPAVFEAVGEVGATCTSCHIENMPPVWNRYNWKDFGTMTMDTPNPAEPKLPWAAAKMKYLVVGYDGIGVNIKNGNQSGAQQSFMLFTTMFDNMNSTCSFCHSSPPRYYTSGDVRGMIEALGEKLKEGDLSEAERLRQGVGMESCYRCHVLHMPAQFAKVDGK